MGNSKLHLRALAFAGALIIVSGLVIGLFQEARAVTMEFATAPATVGASGTFVVDITVPLGERVPIEAITAVIEKRAVGAIDKFGAPMVTTARCEAVTAGCTLGTDLVTFGSKPDAVTAITFVGGFAGPVADGYELGYGYIFDSGSLTFDTTGYGYDTVSPAFIANGYGYGYGYNFGGTSSESLGTGYGYGYGGDDLVLRYAITVNCRELGAGVHFLTALADTGSPIVGDLSTPFTEFTCRVGGGGGGGGDGGGGGTVGLGQSFTGQAGDEFTITGLPAGIEGLTLTLAQNCNGCTVQIIIHSTRPGGAPGLALGFNPIKFIEINILDAFGNELEGMVSGGEIVTGVTATERGNAPPKSLLMLHEEDGGWMPIQTTCDDDSCTGDLPGFSLFAIVIDLIGPDITDPSPTGVITQVTPAITASWSDNRGVDTSSFELRIDNVRKTSSDGSLAVTATGFRFVPATALATEEHDVEVRITDLSGLTSTETWSFVVASPTCPDPPAILSVSPADGATDVALTTSIVINVDEGTCPITDVSVRVNGRAVTAAIVAGKITIAMPNFVENSDEVEVEVDITDSGGNLASDSWSFTTEAAGEEPPPGGEPEGGVPGWVWVVLGLIALVVVGYLVFAYYQKSRGPGPGTPPP